MPVTLEADRLVIGDSLAIPLGEFQIDYVRSSGPGGQNVNKVNSKARLRWNPAESPSLPQGVRDRFLQRYRSRLTNDDELLIAGQQFRDQKRNHDDCLHRLGGMIEAVLTPPTPRKPTRPTAGSKRRRLIAKRQHSEKKQRRKSPDA